MTIVNDITFSYSEITHILTITVTKTTIQSGEGVFAAPAPPVVTVTTIDLSGLA